MNNEMNPTFHSQDIPTQYLLISVAKFFAAFAEVSNFVDQFGKGNFYGPSVKRSIQKAVDVLDDVATGIDAFTLAHASGILCEDLAAFILAQEIDGPDDEANYPLIEMLVTASDLRAVSGEFITYT
jgi:hypothetical protein